MLKKKSTTRDNYVDRLRYPCTCKDGKYTIVQGLEVNDFSRAKMAATETELREERAAIEELLGK